MLSRRRRKDEDEAAALQGQGSYGIPDDDGVCGPGGGDRKEYTAACMDFLENVRQWEECMIVQVLYGETGGIE